MSLYRNILVLIALIAISCGDSSSSEASTPTTGDPSSTGVQQAPPAFQTPPPTAPPTAEPAQNAEGVWHYTCPTGCAGGAGSAVPCATCGTTLVHNTSYHAGGNTQTTPPPIQLDQATPPPPPTAEPAQNTAGVWHFTCPNGCAGGGGKKAPCATCGTELVHNTGYHQ